MNYNFTTLYEYFDSIKEMNLTYGYYEGDFLPYHESFDKRDDFWTGYYSERLHMKRYIYHVFNEIQSTKTLIAIRALHGNHGTVVFNETISSELDEINEYIVKAEREWAILMHHDAITGTHTVHTEPSYYELLKNSQDSLEKARSLTDLYLSVEIPKKSKKLLQGLFVRFDHPKIRKYNIINPIGYDRNNLINITLGASKF